MNKKGFTLIEILLVVMIIGLMLAVILPRGLRATTDAKYNLVRQNAAELASYGNDWIEQQILAQDAISTATRSDYLKSLVEYTTASWIADSGKTNWNTNDSFKWHVNGRSMNSNGTPNGPQTPDNTVEELIEPSKMMRNPFNGASIFIAPSNDPSYITAPIPGAMACAVQPDSSTGAIFDYYSFIFQGTDSTLPGSATVADYHAGMDDSTLAGVREGVFFSKVRQ